MDKKTRYYISILKLWIISRGRDINFRPEQILQVPASLPLVAHLTLIAENEDLESVRLCLVFWLSWD